MSDAELTDAERTARDNWPIVVYASLGRDDWVRGRLAAGDDVNMVAGAGNNEGYGKGATALILASHRGHEPVVRTLLEAGADVNVALADGATALHMAADFGRYTIVALLLAAGASVDPLTHDMTPILMASGEGHLRCVQLLSSYGAERTVEIVAPNCQPLRKTAEAYAARSGVPGGWALFHWLRETRPWSTPLHHLSIIDARRARALLRDGADLDARTAAPEAAPPLSVQFAARPTPLSLARALRASGNAAPGSPADLVLMAAMPWSPRNHELFPADARAFAVDLLLVGRALAREPHSNPLFEGVMTELWVDIVMPAVLTRTSSVANP